MRASQRFINRPIQTHQTDAAEPFFAPTQQSDVQAESEDSFFSPTAPQSSNGEFAGGTVQTKLSVNAPGDKHEQEADAMADQVVQRMSAPEEKDKVHKKGKPEEEEKIQRMSAPEEEKDKVHKKGKPEEEEKVQRMSAPEEEKDKIHKKGKPEEEEKVQRKCAECEKEEGGQVQRQSDGSSTASSGVTQQIESSKGQGSKLSDDTRTQMESSFGTDFSNVTIHTDHESTEMNNALHAQAFTHGSDIYFNEGKYNPQNTEGGRLLAHELTHVVQQGDSLKKKVQRFVQQSEISKGSETQPETSEKESKTSNQPQQNSPPQRPRVSTPCQVKPHGDTTQLPMMTSCPFDNAPPNSAAALMFSVNSSDTSASAQSIDFFKHTWRVNGANAPVKIHGYASVDGTETSNWALSCNRALAAQRELSQPTLDGQPGIPLSFIQIFAQGETNKFSCSDLEANRVVTIHADVPQIPILPPQISRLNIIPCSSFPRVIGHKSTCGTGTDFTHHDFPSLTATQEFLVNRMRPNPNSTLEVSMGAELLMMSQSAGLDAVRHFSGGSGSTVTHGTGTDFSDRTLASDTFSNALTNIKDQIRAQIRSQAKTGTIDCSSIALVSTSLPGINFTMLDDNVLKGVIGGTHGLTVELMNLTINPTGSYDMQLRFTICDNFGVDDHDLYSPGLISFWILQHERTGHVPFINEIIAETPAISDSI